MKTALVLSAGGMYGAYQAGAWTALAGVFRPDLVVGASIGALNGWAIAGGCPPEELVDRWLHLHSMQRHKWGSPRGVFGGVLDAEPLRRIIREMHAAFQPRVEFALVATDLLKRAPRIFSGAEITWRHLAASTAIVGLFEQVRLDGRVYSDGGLLAASPVWAAAALGATRILSIDVLPAPPGAVARAFVLSMRALSRFRPIVPAGVQVIRLSPPRLLGAPLEALCWKRGNAEAWAEQGRREAQAIKHSIANCFERK